MWITDFLEKIFPTKQSIGGKVESIIIDIPVELYYKELAIYQASSLIGNAIGRSEFKVFVNGKPAENHKDYYLLNVSPNANETASLFWHKVINRLIRKNEALIVDVSDKLYCADSFSIEAERPVLGNIYSNVVIDNLTLQKKFTVQDSYYLQLDNVSVSQLIDGVYADYGKILSSAAKAFKKSNGSKYKLHINTIISGDEEFNKEFEDYIQEQLQDYLDSEDAICPEFDGYSLEPDKNSNSKSADDFIKLKSDIFKTVFSAFHIPDSMMAGNITNMREIISAFLTFGVDPFGGVIEQALNKRAGVDNFVNGNFYKVDTGKINHRDIFDTASAIVAVISSGVFCIDEAREELNREPLNTEWSRKHFITKNFAEITEFLKSLPGGGDKNET